MFILYQQQESFLMYRNLVLSQFIPQLANRTTTRSAGFATSRQLLIERSNHVCYSHGHVQVTIIQHTYQSKTNACQLASSVHRYIAPTRFSTAVLSREFWPGCNGTTHTPQTNSFEGVSVTATILASSACGIESPSRRS